MNKKAQEIFSILMLITFVSLVYLVMINTSKIDARTETIGETILELKNVYEKAEKALFYIEQAGFYSLKSIDCNSSEIKNQLNQRLDEYLLNYPDKSFQFPRDNYEITMIKNEKLIIANAKSNLIIQFSKGEYSINPSFSIPCT